MHRIGRTARAGAAGTAISLCSAEEVPFLRAIEKLTRISIPATGSTMDVQSRQRSRDRQQPCRRGGMDSRKQRPAPQCHHQSSVEVRKHRGPAVTDTHGLAAAFGAIGALAFLERNLDHAGNAGDLVHTGRRSNE